jgi:hypothetical protein
MKSGKKNCWHEDRPMLTSLDDFRANPELPRFSLEILDKVVMEIMREDFIGIISLTLLKA